MHKELSILWMYEPEKMPAGQDMDLSTADYYCGLWKLESLLEHLAQESGRQAAFCAAGEAAHTDAETPDLFDLKPSMIVRES